MEWDGTALYEKGPLHYLNLNNNVVSPSLILHVTKTRHNIGIFKRHWMLKIEVTLM